MHLTLTADIGTTSVKLALIDDTGGVRAETRHPTPREPDEISEVYDVPGLWGMLAAFLQSLDDDLRSSIERIAIAGVGESGGLVRSDLSLASPLIFWHDHRGEPYIRALDDAARAAIYRTTGLPANPNYGLAKAAWAVDAAGSIGDAQWLNIAEYLAAVMTGIRWSEYSLASRTLALDLRTREWSAEMCRLFGVDVSLFPELRRAEDGVVVDAGFARDHGLSSAVRVHVAGHDHMVGGVGAHLEPGELLNSTGTTEGLLLLRDAPRLDDATARTKLANGLLPVGEAYTLFASIPTGGSAFETLCTMLDMSSSDLGRRTIELHARYLRGDVDPNATPLVLPRFRGSPPPEKRASARAVISGLGSTSSADDIVFGCFLGMALQFRDVLELLGQSPSAVKVIGPASRNPLWNQLKADLLGVTLEVAHAGEVVSRGAQAIASGRAPAWSECLPQHVEADPGRTGRLREWVATVEDEWDYLKGVPR